MNIVYKRKRSLHNGRYIITPLFSTFPVEMQPCSDIIDIEEQIIERGQLSQFKGNKSLAENTLKIEKVVHPEIVDALSEEEIKFFNGFLSIYKEDSIDGDW